MYGLLSYLLTADHSVACCNRCEKQHSLICLILQWATQGDYEWLIVVVLSIIEQIKNIAYSDSFTEL